MRQRLCGLAVPAIGMAKLHQVQQCVRVERRGWRVSLVAAPEFPYHAKSVHADRGELQSEVGIGSVGGLQGIPELAAFFLKGLGVFVFGTGISVGAIAFLLERDGIGETHL